MAGEDSDLTNSQVHAPENETISMSSTAHSFRTILKKDARPCWDACSKTERN